ncbi:MAG: hypothetical protein V5A23_03335 [Halobacteriales archaeon]
MAPLDAVSLAGTALQSAPVEFVTATPLGKLLVALVVLALVLFVGRFVLGVAWKLLRIAIVVVALLWLISVVVPALG